MASGCLTGCLTHGWIVAVLGEFRWTIACSGHRSTVMEITAESAEGRPRRVGRGRRGTALLGVLKAGLATGCRWPAFGLSGWVSGGFLGVDVVEECLGFDAAQAADVDAGDVAAGEQFVHLGSADPEAVGGLVDGEQDAFGGGQGQVDLSAAAAGWEMGCAVVLGMGVLRVLRVGVG